MDRSEFEQRLDEARQALVEGRVEDLRSSLEPTLHYVEKEPSAGDESGVSTDERLRVVSLLQAAFRFGGVRDDFDRGLALCRPLADRIDEPEVAIHARATMATYYVLSGEFRAMADVCDAAIELASATGVSELPIVGMAHQFRGYALYEWNRLNEAADALNHAWRLAPESRGIRSGTARMMATVCTATGDYDGAATWLARLEEIVSEPMTLRNREWLDAVRALHDGQGRPSLRSADGWAHRYGYPTFEGADVPREEAASRLHEYDHLLTILEATGQWQAMLHVSDAVALGASQTRRWYATRALVARAVALEGLGRIDDALEVWCDALEAGRPEGYVRIYLDGTSKRRSLLRRSVNDARVGALAERLLAESGESEPDISPLTSRQLQVLHHVETGLKNRDIAAAMSVSETTIKTHLRSVYARLEVRSRTQAVAKARKLGLL